MNKYLLTIILTTASGLFAVGGFVVKQYGQSQYDKGILQCEVEIKEAAINTQTRSIKRMEAIREETKMLTPSDIDDELRALGIMREDADR